MRRQPTTAFPLRTGHVMRGFWSVFDREKPRRFERAFAELAGVRHAVTAGSGTAAFYLLLAAAARLKPDRSEVVLPAYSVPTLIHAVRLAGLRAVYCDVEPDTLNMDQDSMDGAVTDRTLALVPFHMFGFPMALDRALEIGRERGVFVFEDACQALGAKIGGRWAGTVGDAGFFSLCKGKIISTFRGGIAVTGNDRLAAALREQHDMLPPSGRAFRFLQPPVMTALAFAMRPGIYGTMYPLIGRFKSTTVHESFRPARFTRYGAGLGQILLGELPAWVEVRRSYGKQIVEGLRGDPGLILPRIVAETEPSYNHAPVVFRDIRRLEKTQRLLWKRGIDTARMYGRPTHHIYPELGYPRDPEPFPGAAYVAPRLLVLPSHPYLRRKDIEVIIGTVRETAH